MTDQSIQCADIVIVGGGAAGCLAAITARETCPDVEVVIIEKASLRRGGCIASGMDAMNVVVIPGVGSVDDLVEAHMGSAMGILDASVVRTIGEESFGILQDLESWGVEFPRVENGNYEIFKQWSHRGGGAVTSVSMAGDLKGILDREVARRGVRRMEHTMATAIFTEGGKVAGVSTFNVRTGDFSVISTPAVIIAAGAAARFGLPETGYLHGTFDCPSNAGDSYSLAFRAGAQLVNMECVKQKIVVRRFNGPGLAPLSHGGILVNGLGQRFLEQGSGELQLSNYMDLFSCVWREYQEGRGPVYVDTSHLSKELVEELERCFFTTERPTYKKFFETRGFKFGRGLVEMALSEPCLCGGHGINGLNINSRAETNVRGLYAAGDAAANGASLMGAFALGKIAAQQAVNLASEAGTPVPNPGEVEAERVRVFAPLRRSSGIPPVRWERKIREAVNSYIGSPKSEAKLKSAQERLDFLRADLSQLKAADFHDTMKALEVQAIFDCADMVVAASLERKESRWGLYHMRIDYPERDDTNWKKFVVVERGASGQVAVSTQPVPGV